MRAWIAVAALVVFSAASGEAQAPPPPSPSPSPAPSAAVAPDDVGDPDPDSADISLTATVRYRELEFEQVGNPKVEFKGGVDAPALGAKAGLATVWHAERVGLPRPVQPGVLYRDGTVRLTITSRFEDLARLFASPAPSPSPSPSPAP